MERDDVADDLNELNENLCVVVKLSGNITLHISLISYYLYF